MIRQRKQRRRLSRDMAGGLPDLDPIVDRTLRLLENSPRGASRMDILAALNLGPNAWVPLREALEETGEVRVVGRGPGLRHVHTRWMQQAPDTSTPPDAPSRSAQLESARSTLRQIIRTQSEIGSAEAQEATGLTSDPVRRLLLELVDEGVVERSGKKRSTRYRWVG